MVSLGIPFGTRPSLWGLWKIGLSYKIKFTACSTLTYVCTARVPCSWKVYHHCCCSFIFFSYYSAFVLNSNTSMAGNGLLLGTCESEMFVWIESQIESAATIRIWIKSRIESWCNRLRVQWLTEVCVFSWFLKQYCTITPTVPASVYMILLHKHIIMNINKSQLQRCNSWSFLLNSERGLWYDGRCGWF